MLSFKRVFLVLTIKRLIKKTDIMKILFKLIYKLIKFCFKIIFLIAFFTLLIPLCASFYIYSGFFDCSKVVSTVPSMVPSAASNAEIEDKANKLKATFKDYQRPEANSFLSFPEWYTIFSAQEYARFTEKKLPSQFPHFDAVKQYWQSYCYVNNFTKKNYPFDRNQHIMIMAVGTGFTAQHLVKGLYEKSLGRLSEKSNKGKQVSEDTFAHKIANEYGQINSVLQRTQFPFFQKLTELWQQTPPFQGQDAIRRWERKIALSTEYAFKGLYNWGLAKGIEKFFPKAQDDTKLWASELKEAALNNPQVKKLGEITDTSYLLSLPRYQPFTTVAMQLVEQGAQFNDIANNHVIMLSAVVPAKAALDLGNTTVLFTFPLLTDKEQKRIVVVTPVSTLPETTKRLTSQGTLEHIYDY